MRPSAKIHSAFFTSGPAQIELMILFSRLGGRFGAGLGDQEPGGPMNWWRPPVAGNNAYHVNRLLFQHLPLDLREKRDSSVADLHGQVNPETNSNSTFFIIYFSVSHI